MDLNHNVNKTESLQLDDVEAIAKEDNSKQSAEEQPGDEPHVSAESSSCSDDQEVKPKIEKKKKTVRTLSPVGMEDDESTEEEASYDVELRTFREAFELFDPDKTGIIPRDQLSRCLQTVCATLPPDEIEQIISQVEASDEDEINFEMFADMARYTQTIVDREREILEAFLAFDPERNGYITAEDLSLALLAFDKVISSSEARQLISMLVTKDGRFYYEPFIKNFKEMGLLDEL